MAYVQVRNVKIGEGIPKICVPIVGRTREEIIGEAKTFDQIPMDLVEWRVDWFDDVMDMDQVVATAKELREVLQEIPVLFTFRTANEGGEKAISLEDYVALNKAIAASSYVDLIDVEAFTGEEAVREVIEAAHSYGVKVVVSNHDFHKTPSKEELVRRLCYMQELGADLPKIAVMPENKKDVLTLLVATEEMEREHPETPVITMSMSASGVISRICGECFGSALTFGAAAKASAPGQMGVCDLRKVLEILHGSL